MIPSYFVRLEQMPLTPNGKLDRRALPAPESSVQSGEAYLAPRTAVEAQMVLIWQDILGVTRVGVRDNFFEIGGHSLRATVLVSRIHKELGCSISLREVFQSPTVESLAQLVKNTFRPCTNPSRGQRKAKLTQCPQRKSGYTC